MDNRIETFFKLYQTMNYHETARQLNMTQPAVTQHIKSLEAEYNCHFFIYDHKKLYRTEDADIFESFVRSILFNAEKMRSCLSKPKIRKTRIGATKSIGEFMLADIAARYLKDTSLTAEITVDNTSNLLMLLDQNQIDFALVEGEFNKERYESRIFRTEPLCGICASGHCFAGKTVDIEELFDQTLIIREYGSGTRGVFDDILRGFGYSVKYFSRTVTVNEFSLLTALVARGTGISFVYDAVAQNAPNIGTFSISGIHPTHALNYVFLKDTVAKSLVDEFEKSDRVSK